nr:transposase family protein [Micromonospora citrea]
MGLSTSDEQARCCPQCGQRTVRVKQWATTWPRDLPVGGRPVRLRWRDRRWYCPTTTCPRGADDLAVEAGRVGRRTAGWPWSPERARGNPVTTSG